MKVASVLKGVCAALLLILVGCQTPPQAQPSVLPHASGKQVEVGWIAARDTFDLSARIGNKQPKDYIVWVWENRNIIPLETVTVELAIYASRVGPKLWSDTYTGTWRRVWIPEELALRAVLMCAEVKGRTIAHAEQVVEKNNKVFTSCTGRLPESVASGKAAKGFGIPLVIEKEVR